MQYFVQVNTLPCEGEESRELGGFNISAGNNVEAERKRERLVESFLESEDQDHSHTMWYYDHQYKDWIEMGTSSVVFN